MNEQNMTKRELRKQKRVEKLEKQARVAQQEKRKSYITWGVALVIIAGIITFAIKSGGNNPVPPINNPIFVQEDDHIKGEGRVALIEYSDFQCPACAAYQPIVKQLEADFSGDLQVVFRHFPLNSIHAHAEEAARAVEAAGMQDEVLFWSMADKLFETQTLWSNMSNPMQEFEKYAEELGLDVEQFKVDYASDYARGRVLRDLNSANKLRLNGTPTFFLQGKQVQSPNTYEAFRALIQAALDSTPELIPFGEEEQLPVDITATTTEDVEAEDGIDASEEPANEQSADPSTEAQAL